MLKVLHIASFSYQIHLGTDLSDFFFCQAVDELLALDPVEGEGQELHRFIECVCLYRMCSL